MSCWWCRRRCLRCIPFFILEHIVILLFPSHCRRCFMFFHHKEAFFFNFMIANFTFLLGRMSLYSKKCSTVWSHSINSSRSKWPSKSNIHFYTQCKIGLILVLCCLRLLGEKGFLHLLVSHRCFCGWPHVASFQNQRASIEIGEFYAAYLPWWGLDGA